MYHKTDPRTYRTTPMYNPSEHPITQAARRDCTGPLTGAPDPSQTSAAIDLLSGAIDQLAKRLGDLEARLEPVLREIPMPAQGQPDKHPAPAPARSQLASHLTILAHQLLENGEQVSRILHRLDL